MGSPCKGQQAENLIFRRHSKVTLRKLRLTGFDRERIGRHRDGQGSALLQGVLSPEECETGIIVGVASGAPQVPTLKVIAKNLPA